MGNESVGSGEKWQLVEFKVRGDVHVDYVTREIGQLTGCGTDADPREGTVRVYVPPTRKDEAYLIADEVSRSVKGLSFLGIQNGK